MAEESGPQNGTGEARMHLRQTLINLFSSQDVCNLDLGYTSCCRAGQGRRVATCCRGNSQARDGKCRSPGDLHARNPPSSSVVSRLARHWLSGIDRRYRWDRGGRKSLNLYRRRQQRRRRQALGMSRHRAVDSKSPRPRTSKQSPPETRFTDQQPDLRTCPFQSPSCRFRPPLKQNTAPP